MQDGEEKNNLPFKWTRSRHTAAVRVVVVTPPPTPHPPPPFQDLRVQSTQLASGRTSDGRAAGGGGGGEEKGAGERGERA